MSHSNTLCEDTAPVSKETDILTTVKLHLRMALDPEEHLLRFEFFDLLVVRIFIEARERLLDLIEGVLGIVWGRHDWKRGNLI